MKLKPVRIIALLLIIGVAAYFVTRPKQIETRTNNTELTKAAPDTNRIIPDKTTSDTTIKESRPKFNYIKEKVVDGTLHGVVEVGASGFNSFIINLDSKKRWEIISKDYGKSLVYEGLATAEAIRAGLTKYRAAMAAKGVEEKNMHFVVSSGAQKQPKTTSILQELRSSGILVTAVTPEEEAKYALKATLPRVYYDNSFMVDMGSGNTKISWDEEGILKSMELPGSRYHEKGTTDETVYNETKSKISKLPPEKGDVCFIIGGVVKALAEQHRKGQERYTVLKEPRDYKPTDKKMSSGLNIYKAIVDGTQTDTFVFDWDANFSIGYLLSLK
jgi:ribosomal protein S11